MSDDGKRTRGLGRGLSALLSDSGDDKAKLDRLRGLRPVPIERLHPGPVQPRRTFDPQALEELAASIREKGVLQPILVRRHPERPDEFEIVAGERRWRAAQMAQLHEVPVVVRELEDGEALEIAIIENVQREDLNPIEEAEGYRRLIGDYAYTQDQVARMVGKSRAHIANTTRLLGLPDDVRQMVSDGSLSAGHARSVLTADDPSGLARRIAEQGLTVREAERLARDEKQPEESAGTAAPTETPSGTASGSAGRTPGSDADTLALERQLSERLGLKVQIRHRGEKGEVTIRFQTLDQFDDILGRLSQTPRSEQT